MTESELYKEFGALTKDKDNWEKNSVCFVSSCLWTCKIHERALWLSRRDGICLSYFAQDVVPAIVSFRNCPEPLMRECAVNAIGRNGRAEYSLIVSYWTELFRFASVKDAKVRLSIISGHRKTSLQLKGNKLMNIRARIEVAEVLACEVISNTVGLRLAGHGIIEY